MRFRCLWEPSGYQVVTIYCMGSKWLGAAAVIAIALTGCTHSPPPYAPYYTPPLATTPSPPRLPPGASFVDMFDRPDTASGLGEGWDMREADDGNPLLPPTADGFISDGHFISSSNRSIYAARTFRSVVRRVGAEGRWMPMGIGNEGTRDEKLVMAITANDRLKSDVLQFATTPTGWEVSTRRGGGKFRREMSGTFIPPLERDREYRFEMDAMDSSVTVKMPGVERKGNVGTIGLLSDRAYWQLAPAEPPNGGTFAFNMVWAAEQDQVLTSLPGPR